MALNAGGGRAARTYLTAREKPWEGSEGCEEGDGGEVAGLAAALAPLAVDAAGADTGGGRPEAGPGQAPCLMAGGGAYDPSAPGADAPPLTAEEYLRRVRWEASQLPDVVVASQVRVASSSKIGSDHIPSLRMRLSRCSTLSDAADERLRKLGVKVE